MTKYILDTNICIEYFKDKPSVTNRIDEIGLENIYVSEITIAELRFGAEKSKKQKHFDEVENLLKSVNVLCIFDTLKCYAKLQLSKFIK